MSLRLKLTLSFIAVSLTVAGIFSAVAYTSARDYTRHVELTRLHKSNKHLLDMLDKSQMSIQQLQAMAPHHEDDSNHFSIIDIQQKEVISNDNRGLGAQLLKRLATDNVMQNNQQGSFAIGDQEYLWAANTLPGGEYMLIDTYHRDSSDISTFLEYIGTPIGIALFIGVWVAIWASAILTNLFQQIAEKNIQLEYQASHDALTKLPNRSAISHLVQQHIEAAKAYNEKILFCLVDLDALKEINDSLGHESGDILLGQVTQRLKHTLRSSDQMGRFGGNKFALMLNHSDSENIDTICTRVLENFEPIFEINGHNLYIRTTLGIAVFPDHATGAQELIQKAETALHKARAMAVEYSVYDLSRDANRTDRLRLTHDLRNAIHNEELELYYQPQLDVRSGVITSVEALARWIHPQHGFVPPDTFIEIAEHTGLIRPLTDWVLRTAIEQSSHWQEMNIHLKVSINLSAKNLHDEALGGQISNLLSYWGVNAESLCLEITETAMMTDPEHARKLLNALDTLGLRISIDDFGTGYSSLGYLKQLPVDELKIDKSFVLNMASDENDASIVRATVSLAHDLGLDVVAEGVEDQASQDELSRLGCEYIQGYHIARPMPHHELTPMLVSKEASNDEQLTDSTTDIQPKIL